MEKLLIVDGNSLLATSFYGTVPPTYYGVDKTNKKEVEKALERIPKANDGTHLNAIYIYFQVLGNAIRHKGFENLIITWDKTRNTFRREIYKDYKANRSDPDIAMLAQETLARQMLESANIKYFWDDKYEADDLIGSLAERFKDTHEVYIMSKDQDILQLLDENVYVWLKTQNYSEMIIERNKDRSLTLNGYYEFTPEEFRYFYGLDNPKLLIDAKGLMGDAGDNIPGVKGIGEKTAYPLVNHFKSVEELYKFVDCNCKKDCDKVFKDELDIRMSPYNKLVKEKDIALMSKELATIRTDIDYIHNLTDEDIKLNIDNDNFNLFLKEKNIVLR